MDLKSRPGIIRYTLTKHFQDNGLVPDWWFAAINPVLERAIARATGNPRRPSEESSLAYLERYMREQDIKELDPTEGFAVVVPDEFKLDRPSLDWNRENYLQENNPLKSRRWKLLRRFVFNRDGEQCACCGNTSGPLHIDHIKPRAKYPALMWEPDNLQVLCRPCNNAKLTRETDYRKKAA